MRFLSLSLGIAASLAASIRSAEAGDLLYFQSNDGQSTYGPSQVWSSEGVLSEVADDFELIASLDRVRAGGFIWGTTPEWQGVFVRFYAQLADGSPGDLQREFFVPYGSPDLTVDDSGLVDVRLDPPFAANGKHFLSVQPVVNQWYWWSANTNAPRGEPFFYRDLTVQPVVWRHGDGQAFSNPNADVEFSLYGTIGGPGTIDHLSAGTLPRSGYLEIFGANFGGNGAVRVAGLAAPIAVWTSVRIVAYVPEGTPLGTADVEVVTGGGTSNSLPLQVTTRQPDGLVNWRLRMEGPYSVVRPAQGPDGTIYAIDVYSRLYAVSPEGAVRWVVRGAGDKGLAVGQDGSIYVGSESHVNAYAPDGSLKWSFEQQPRAFILLGLAVGPDGNIYGVATEGLGVFSLTPSGTLRWTNPESYDRPIVDYGEIVFGPNGSHDQLYFSANNHTRAVRLDNGASVFTIAPRGQPAVSPLDGTMHFGAAAYAPNSQFLWSFDFGDFQMPSAPDLAVNGTHYVVNRTFELWAIQPNGDELWHANVVGPVGPPNVDPTNRIVVLGRSGPLNEPGFLMGFEPGARGETWRVMLPPEETSVYNPWTGLYGFHQYVDSRVCFTADGATAFVITAIATGGLVQDRCFLYSISTGLGSGTLPTAAPDIESSAPLSFTASPNPVRNGTSLSFDLARDEDVRVRIHDVGGRLVREMRAQMSAGRRSLWWDGRDASGRRVPSGVYLAKVVAGNRVATTKVLVIR